MGAAAVKSIAAISFIFTVTVLAAAYGGTAGGLECLRQRRRHLSVFHRCPRPDPARCVPLCVAVGNDAGAGMAAPPQYKKALLPLRGSGLLVREAAPSEAFWLGPRPGLTGLRQIPGRPSPGFPEVGPAGGSLAWPRVAVKGQFWSAHQGRCPRVLAGANAVRPGHQLRFVQWAVI